MSGGDNRPLGPRTVLAAAQALIDRGGRQLLGLAGPPGAGKSTLAATLEAAFPDRVQVVPMDGFHLANCELQRLGRRDRKGAPDTFDAAGYVALLQRLRRQRDGEVVYAPEFRREIDEAVANAIAVQASTRLVITEGNYLLLQGAWSGLADVLDETWYVELDGGQRRDRLALRHQQYGLTRDQAQAWVAQTDEPNADLVEALRRGATRVFRWDTSQETST